MSIYENVDKCLIVSRCLTYLISMQKKRCKAYYKPKEDDPLYAKDLGKKPTFKSPSLLRQPNDNQIFLCHL